MATVAITLPHAYGRQLPSGEVHAVAQTKPAPE